MSLLESICAHCWLHSIRELGLEKFTDALIHFKEDEKYSDLLSNYNFDENKVSQTLINELAGLLLDKKLMYLKPENAVFITMNNNQITNVLEKTDSDESKLINDMLEDYRIYNTQKELIKKA